MAIFATSFLPPIIAASMLKCDSANLEGKIEKLDRAGTRWFHWDVMDGHFVPNLSYGAMVIQSVRSRTQALFEVHLMITDPAKYLDEYIRAGCDVITFHIEAVPEPAALLKRIKSAGCQAGLAINPKTPSRWIEPFLEECDLVLVMSVEPGFGGQKFMPEVLDKARSIRTKLPPQSLLSIDGGIATSTVGAAAATGCQIFVAGSAIFDEDNYSVPIRNLEEAAREHIPEAFLFST